MAANPSIQLGTDGNWAIKEDNLLAYKKDGDRFFNKEFDFTRGSVATYVDKDGLIKTATSDIPRIDFLNNTKGHLLLEPARTNLFPYSEDFENSDWTKNAGTTITNNYAISPDGTLNAARYLGTGASGLGDKFTLSATEHTISFYVKSNTGQNQYCRITGDSSQTSADLLVTTEWQRIEFTFTASGLANKTNGIFRDSNNNDIDILIWGAQLEEGSYATSYIPTQGSAVTRSAENITQKTPNLSNSQEVTAFIDLGARPITGSNVTGDAIEFYFSSGNRIVYNQNGSSKHRIEINTDGSSTRNYYATNSYSSTSIKIAIAVTQSTLRIITNRGDLFNVAIEGVANWSTLSVIKTNISESIGNIKINDLKFYNTALTDAELIALTS